MIAQRKKGTLTRGTTLVVTYITYMGSVNRAEHLSRHRYETLGLTQQGRCGRDLEVVSQQGACLDGHFSMREGEGNGRLKAGRFRVNTGRYVINTG